MARLGDRAAAGAWGLQVLRRLEGLLGPLSLQARKGVASPSREASPAQAGPGAAPPRVLVVDDDPFFRVLTSEMLVPWGIRPLLAGDGAEAVALASELPLDLILMDLQMPRLDGLAATRQIRAVEQAGARARVPIVAYTSDPGADPRRLLDGGIDALLHKPCSAQALHECVLRWCAGAGERDRGAETGA